MLILNDYQRFLLKGPFQEALNIKKPPGEGNYHTLYNNVGFTVGYN